MYKNYKTFEDQDAKVQKYVDFVNDYGPYRFFASISFQYKLTDSEGIAYGSEHVKRLNKKLLGRSWAKQEIQCLTGMATLEHASILKRSYDGHRIKDRGSCHFHFLLRDHPCFDRNLETAVYQLADAWAASARSLNYRETRKLVSAHGTDVQCVQTNAVTGYILKEARLFSWGQQERLFYLDGKGLLSIDATPILRSPAGSLNL